MNKHHILYTLAACLVAVVGIQYVQTSFARTEYQNLQQPYKYVNGTLYRVPSVRQLDENRQENFSNFKRFNALRPSSSEVVYPGERMDASALVPGHAPDYPTLNYRDRSDYGYARDDRECIHGGCQRGEPVYLEDGLFPSALEVNHPSINREDPRENTHQDLKGVCRDSDDDGFNQGRDVYVQGLLKENEFVGVDTCLTRTKLREYFCENSRYRYREFRCLNGCVDGACIPLSR